MKKYLFLTFLTLVLLAGLFVYQYVSFNDGKLHVVFCDVGQGDAIFIRTPKGTDILVDGGGNDSALSCLSNHMPFWDKSIELMILTHPHEDHLRGLLSVLDAYAVSAFYTEDLVNTSTGFQKLMRSIQEKQIQKRFLFAGDSFSTKDGLRFYVVTPTQAFLSQSSPGGEIGESREFGSLSIVLEFGTVTLLLTGDTQAPQLEEALRQAQGELSQVDVLQVPHHGSKTGLSEKILENARPKLAVISVGAKNRYGHPAGLTLRLLDQFGIPVKRTDKDGEVELVTDGSEFQLAK